MLNGCVRACVLFCVRRRKLRHYQIVSAKETEARWGVARVQGTSPNLENRFCFHWAESKASQRLAEGQCPHTSGHADPGHEPDKHWLGRHGSARGMGKRP